MERYVDHTHSLLSELCYDFGDVRMQITVDLLPVFVEISVASMVELHHDFFLVASRLLPSQNLEVVNLLKVLLLL